MEAEQNNCPLYELKGPCEMGLLHLSLNAVRCQIDAHGKRCTRRLTGTAYLVKGNGEQVLRTKCVQGLVDDSRNRLDFCRKILLDLVQVEAIIIRDEIYS